MAISSDALQLGLVEEASPGTTPPSPAFDLVRITGEGLSLSNSSTESTELSGGGGSRGAVDSILTGAEVTGDINFELAKSTALEILLSAALASDWGDDPFPIPIGADEVYDWNKVRTFSLEKRWQITDTPDYNYHLFTGCMVNTMSLSISPGEPITGSFGFIGNSMVISDTALPGATYTPAGNAPVMTAPLVTSIELIDRDTDTPVSWLNNACFTSLDLTIDNGSRGIQCIGILGNKEVVLGRLTGTASGSLYYAVDDPLIHLLDQKDFRLRIVTTDSLGNEYEFLFDRVKFSETTVNATGTNEDVLTNFTLVLLRGDPNPLVVTVKRTAAP